MPATPAPCRSLVIGFGEGYYKIDTNSELLNEVLRHLYQALIVPYSDHGNSFQITYGLFLAKGLFQLTRRNKLAYSFKSLPKALPRFDWMLMSDLVDRHRSLPLVHASAVSDGTRSIIFAGQSESGKSTLGFLMARMGWGMISDDVVSLGKAVTGISRAFCLGETLAGDIFPAPDFQVKALKRDKSYAYINPSSLGIKVLKSGGQPSHIFFLKNRPAAETITKLSQAQILGRLIENLFDTGEAFHNKLDGLANIAEKAKGFELSSSNPKVALDLVMERLHGGS